ncbi:hypothetical protein J5N97_004832 [Dioscorea zingiberensis]|uniref:Uncharacterized protein n=1 Tax=Dioscorea zingiberensis TaxID=325984 RepID=A0A9D5HS70_9LILI|nr:hypothetical protein J5N97_004832 [Dioscorea zingiberensis]
MAGVVLVFDFDKTIIDCDSDEWVVDELGASELFQQLMPTMSWNTLMDRMMKELHSQGKTSEDIVECLRRVHLDTHIISAIKSAYALGCDLRVVSDANLLFIETILKHHELLECFSEINTNPCYVDEDGRLRILPYNDPNTSHGCSLCPPNMCKGRIIERIKALTSTKGEQLIYLGDGKGDYCPSLRLTEGDHVMARKGYPLWELVSENAKLIKAEIHEWSNGEELERILMQLIPTLMSPTAPSFISMDCKHETMPMASHESISQALPVPHS